MPPMTPMETLRSSLPDAGSPRFWRALEELSDDPVRRALLDAAMPQLAAMVPAMDRRGFLKLLGASLAFAGLTACSGPPPENIVAERGGDDASVPDTARYATALDVGGGNVIGVVATLRDGRPVKLDGNPRHPLSLGGSDARVQAAILDVWDPSRSDTPRFRGGPTSWDAFDAAFAELRAQHGSDAEGLHIVSGAVVSPTLARQRDALLTAFPRTTWHEHEPVRVSWQSLGLADRKIIVAFDADFLGSFGGHLAHAREFAEARAKGARLYVVEPTPSLTGRNADHTWPVDPSAMATATGAVLACLEGREPPAGDATLAARATTIADALMKERDRALVVAGPWTDPAVHADVARMQAILGHPQQPSGTPRGCTLVDDLRAGRVQTLIILGTNPAYTLRGFAAVAARAEVIVHLGRYRDETAALATWHLPALHPFESWSDLLAPDGTASIVQPLLAPRVPGRTPHDIVDGLLGTVAPDPLARVRKTWPNADDVSWRRGLQDGVIDRHVPPLAPGLLPTARPSRSGPGHAAGAAGGLELAFRPDPNLWDGRHASNAWLQELPRTVTTLTWGNALLISPELAQEQNWQDGEVARLEFEGNHIEGPVLVVPGQAPRTVTVLLGNGCGEGLGKGFGYDGYALRRDDTHWHGGSATLRKTGRTDALALAQPHQDMGTRDAIRVVAPGAPTEPPQTLPSFYPSAEAGKHRWGMVIDLAACIGCNACTASCQAENNIPVVGKAEVARGRRMHWIRVDAYFQGSPAAPHGFHQPVPCMHCEHAPCEVVCPVEATVHDREGLNLQVYNRCIGTRFCANNCPYKVRRFNFLQYADLVTESLKAMRNPDVSVRNKGVMEKCTYCVQRIEGAHAEAARQHGDIAPDAVTTACQDACPTQAISFGDLDRPNEALAKALKSPRRYVLLESLNTRPRTTYLAAIRNPDPAWPNA